MGSRVGAVAWSVSFMVIGYLLSMTAGALLFGIAASRAPLVMGSPTAGLQIQSMAGIAVYGILTWVVGRRALRLSFAELGFLCAPTGSLI